MPMNADFSKDDTGRETRRQVPLAAIDGDMRIQVIYAPSGKTIIRDVLISFDATAMAAVAASDLLREYPQLLREAIVLACHGRRIQADAPIRAGQRIEILRPLQMSPKEARRQLAAKRAARNKRKVL